MMTPNELFSLLSDETRLRCLILLQKEGELCVCEISETLKRIQPKISRHLALMRKSGLVSDERRGTWVYYSLNQSLPAWAKRIIESTLENLINEEPYRSDCKTICSLKKENICKTWSLTHKSKIVNEPEPEPDLI
jgi:ArsR family transcriptional regulator, arsenate/arsenite/antimonite-responsive transcriptional repressor